MFYPSVLQVLLLCLFVLLLKFVRSFILVPWRIHCHFKKQGILGPGYRVISGNLSEVRKIYEEAQSKPHRPFRHGSLRYATPCFYKWSRLYGKNFLYWSGTEPTLVMADPKLIKEVSMKVDGAIDLIASNHFLELLFGKGLPAISGEMHTIHRRIVHQAFTMESVKVMIPKLVASTTKMLEKWEKIRGERDAFEIDFHKEVHALTSDVTSTAVFGSSSEAGKHIFELQGRLKKIIVQSFRRLNIPGYRFLPTKENRESWRLHKEIHQLILKLLQTHEAAKERSGNLLSLLMSPYRNQDGREQRLSEEEIIDECKTFYTVSKETSADAFTWMLLLLAYHKDWQSKAREEVFGVCGDQGLLLEANLSDLKIVNMVIQESLRLFSPVPFIWRKTSEPIKLGKIDVPANTTLEMHFTAMSQDPDLWGGKADEFDPTRFSESRAAFLPFGIGYRNCIGQTLAIVEAKIILAMILREYSFHLSPTYVHNPVLVFNLEPRDGAQIIFRKLRS